MAYKLRLVNTLGEIMRKRIADSDIVETIASKQPISCTNLAGIYNITRQAMHLRLTKLERRGRVTREPGAGRRPGLYSLKVDKPWLRAT